MSERSGRKAPAERSVLDRYLQKIYHGMSFDDILDLSYIADSYFSFSVVRSTYVY